jgi:parallel beta-helix repeat protein
MLSVIPTNIFLKLNNVSRLHLSPLFLFCCFLFLLPSQGFSGEKTVKAVTANTYYVDAVSGNDNNNGLSTSSAWQTLAKVNKTTFQTGDQVLFRRGQTFQGSLRVNNSGIVFSAYGTGEKPLISGLTTVSSWASAGTGMYEASVNAGKSLNMVLVNNNITPMGRYPNGNTFLTIDSHNGTTSITDAALPASPSWTGAEVVIRKTYWLLDRAKITSHSGTTINYVTPTGYSPNDGYGYFIQNSLRTLDQPGEWFYNPSTKKLTMFFGITVPASYQVRVSTEDTLVFVKRDINNITFDNLALEGGDTSSIRLQNNSNVRIIDCEIRNSGTNGIDAEYANYLLIDRLFVDRSNNIGVNVKNSSDSKLNKSQIKNSGLIPGLGLSNNQQMCGVSYLFGANDTIQYNRIDSSGYCGIMFTGNYNIVRNNFVNYTTMTVSDGGGIYTYGDQVRPGIEITDNIVLNGVGNTNGAEPAPHGNGIYLDEKAANVTIRGNTIANHPNFGMYLHDAHQVTIENNTFYNNTTQLFTNYDQNQVGDPIRDIIFKNNILFAKTKSQLAAVYSSLLNDFHLMGAYDNNFYVRPFDNNGIINTVFHSGNKIDNYYDLQGWKAAFPAYDVNSNTGPVAIAPFTVNSQSATNLFSNGSFNSNNNGAFCMSAPGSCAVTWNSGGRLDNGAIEVAYTGGGTNLDIGTYIGLGNVTAGKDYIVRFSLIGENPVPKTFRALLLNTAGYTPFSQTQFFKISNTRTENVYHFRAQSSAEVVLTFLVTNLTHRYWVDNVRISEASVTHTNPDDVFRFVYNETDEPKVFSLDGDFKDVRNVDYRSSITLQPYRSAVLIKVGAGTGTVEPENKVPVAKAGTDMVVSLPTNTAILDGSTSADPDGTIVAHNWVQTAGPTSSIVNSEGAVTQVNSLTAGNYTFRLTVTDNRGGIASDEVNLTVKANGLPVANAGADVTFSLPTNTTTLNGTASNDSDGSITNYAWARTSGPTTFTITNNTTATPTLSNLVRGTYVFRLTVTDNLGAKSNDLVSIIVLANKPPVVNAGDDVTITLPTNSVRLDGTRSTDADGYFTKALWTKYSGPASFNIQDPSSGTPLVTNLVRGTYTFKLVGTDNGGATGTDYVKVVVLAAPLGAANQADGSLGESISSEALPEASFRLYPNPVISTLHVQFNDAQTGSMKLLITDALGKTIVNEVIVKNSPAFRKEINVNSFRPGVYYLSIISKEKKYSSYFVK